MNYVKQILLFPLLMVVAPFAMVLHFMAGSRYFIMLLLAWAASLLLSPFGGSIYNEAIELYRLDGVVAWLSQMAKPLTNYIVLPTGWVPDLFDLHRLPPETQDLISLLFAGQLRYYLYSFSLILLPLHIFLVIYSSYIHGRAPGFLGASYFHGTSHAKKERGSPPGTAIEFVLLGGLFFISVLFVLNGAHMYENNTLGQLHDLYSVVAGILAMMILLTTAGFDRTFRSLNHPLWARKARNKAPRATQATMPKKRSEDLQSVFARRDEGLRELEK